MKPSLTDTLCTRCGLCCDGSLFADVELAPRDDSAALEGLGLVIEDDDDRRGGEVILQPCGALQGRRCGIYVQRPGCCRTFECRLLRDVRRGTMTLDVAGGHITAALKEITAIGRRVDRLGFIPVSLPWKERAQEVLTLTEESTDPAVMRAREELEEAMTSLDVRLHRTFLGR